MKAPSSVDIGDTVMAFLRQRQLEHGMSGGLEPTTAVFDSGLLDSVSLMELVLAVEAASGHTLDMLLFDPSEVGTLDELVQSLTTALAG